MYFPDQSPLFAELLNELAGQRVAVLGHMRPDGDCIGSQVALCRVLNEKGISAVAVNQDPAPRVLKPFLGDTPFAEASAFQKSDEVAMNVDCADALRIGQTLQQTFPKVFANIDHHISNTLYGEHNIVEDYTSATAEILAGLFLDNDLPIDPVTAQALYVGIATDTGQFRFPATSPQVFKICSDLIDRGANPGAAAQVLYENESFNKLDLLQRFLGSLKLEHAGRVCIGIVRAQDFAETGATREDSEGLVDYARSVEDVEIGVILEEREGNVIKGSLRAKEAIYRVDRLAQQFDGGGHACAAGFSQKHIAIDVFYPQLLDALGKHLAKLGTES